MSIIQVHKIGDKQYDSTGNYGIGDSDDIDERKKIRRTKNFFIKKSKDILLDSRFTGIISIVMILCLPFYIGHRSSNPVFFGMYSVKFMILNSVYLVSLLILTFIYFKNKRK